MLTIYSLFSWLEIVGSRTRKMIFFLLSVNCNTQRVLLLLWPLIGQGCRRI